MSQRAAIAAIDARLHAALADAGLADTGTYTAPGVGATPVTCRAYADKGVTTVGEYAVSYSFTATVTILRADVADPREGGIVAIDGSSYTLRQLIDSDDGITVWGCA